MNPFLAAQFNTQFVPGVGHVEVGNPSAGALGQHLGDDSSIMMISGLGGLGEEREVGQTRSIMVDAKKWWDAVPWWVWVLVALGALSAGAYLFRNLKKG